MSFTIETTKWGKPYLVYKESKYKENRVSRTGEIIWRCLVWSCGAEVKTDASMTELTAANEKHTGRHPATWRSPGQSPARTAPLLSQVYVRKVTATAFSQTDGEASKTKDELVARVHELTDGQSSFIEYIQDLKKQLECAKEASSSVEGDLTNLRLSHANVLSENSALTDLSENAKTELAQLHKAYGGLQKQLEELSTQKCKKCVAYEEEMANIMSTVRIIEDETAMLQSEFSLTTDRRNWRYTH